MGSADGFGHLNLAYLVCLQLDRISSSASQLSSMPESSYSNDDTRGDPPYRFPSIPSHPREGSQKSRHPLRPFSPESQSASSPELAQMLSHYASVPLTSPSFISIPNLHLLIRHPSTPQLDRTRLRVDYLFTSFCGTSSLYESIDAIESAP